MKKSVAIKWAAALRSDEYPQGKGMLQDDEGNYCCLGVLCKVAEKEGVIVIMDKLFGGLKGTTLGDQPHVLAWSGIRNNHGTYPNSKGYMHSITYLNDEGSSFSEIADIIESFWELL